MASPLNPNDKDQITRLYNDRFQKLGYDHKTVGWGSKADQNLRFEVLCRNLNLTGKRILDVGCGLGDLIPFLRSKYLNFSYHGIDIASELISHAREQFQSENILFDVSEVFDIPDTTRYDAILLSGALSFRIEDNLTHTKKMIATLFAMTEDVLSLNFLSSYVTFQDPKNFHYSPEEMFGYVKNLTRYVNLMHDYPLWEFSLQLFKQPK
jgi:SAM-dependent methyltransferase